MAYKSFVEYLDGKSKLVNTGKVQDVADYNGPIPTKPGKEKKHKDAGGEGQKGEPKPYAGGVNAKDPNKGKLKDGFAGKGDTNLEYNPGKKANKAGKASNSSGVPGGKVVPSTWNKTKTQEWLDKTKGLSLAEFTKHLQKKTSKNINLDECACQGTTALEVVKQTVNLAKANESVMLSLIQELKRSKAFGKFMAEALQHDYTYSILAKFMESDEKYARRLVRAMNEMVGPPAHHEDGDEDPSKPPHPEDMHGDDDDDLGGLGDEHPHDHMKDGPPDEDDDGDMFGDDEDDDFESDPNEMGGDGHDGPEPSDGPHGHHGDPDSDIAPGSKIMPQKKKHGHHHLMNALKDSPMGHSMGDMGGLGGSMGGMGGI